MIKLETTSEWAQRILYSNAVILDTETTGLSGTDQVIQIAVIDTWGVVRFDTLVQPTAPISRAAHAVHGIHEGMLADAPWLPDVLDQLAGAVAGRTVIAYNAPFDRRLLTQSLRAWRRAPAWFEGLAWECAMKRWCDYMQSSRYLPLTGGDHTAVGDCRATLARIREMAAGDSRSGGFAGANAVEDD